MFLLLLIFAASCCASEVFVVWENPHTSNFELTLNDKLTIFCMHATFISIDLSERIGPVFYCENQTTIDINLINSFIPGETNEIYDLYNFENKLNISVAEEPNIFLWGNREKAEGSSFLIYCKNATILYDTCGFHYCDIPYNGIFMGILNIDKDTNLTDGNNTIEITHNTIDRLPEIPVSWGFLIPVIFDMVYDKQYVLSIKCPYDTVINLVTSSYELVDVYNCSNTNPVKIGPLLGNTIYYLSEQNNKLYFYPLKIRIF